jgi:dolichyl-phosphate beta-glucosyltransferase
MDLSIVIPVYNEGKKIENDVRAALRFLSDNHLTGEIIVVDDGSIDNTAAKANKAVRRTQTPLRVICYEQHRGKGFAVRTGMKVTCGEYVMFVDSGLCVPYYNALIGLELIKRNECDIAHGSRKLKESKIRRQQPLTRRIIGTMMRWILIAYIQLPSEISDSQCGFKIYKGDIARKLYGQCLSNGFLFDVEIIMRAIKNGYHIKEFPIDWTSDPDTRLSPIRNLWDTLCELIALKRILNKFCEANT